MSFMSIFLETFQAFCWVSKVLSAFWRVRAWTTLGIILAKVIGRFANLLAFFLPLKVILLAGSEGVPRYFQFFVGPDDKAFWIIVFAIGAVGCYALKMFMDFVVKALAEAGGVEVLQGANEIAVASHHRNEIKGYYARFSGLAANVLITVLSFSVLGMVNPALGMALGGLALLEYLFTACIVQYGNPLQPGRLFRIIKRKLQGYLDVLGSINFLCGFFVILIPFLSPEGGNLLFAILSILIMRQSFGAMKGIARGTSELWKERPKIDPMVFRHRQTILRERAVTLNLRQAFPRDGRAETAKKYLADHEGYEDIVIDSLWKDSPVKGIYTFHLQGFGSRVHLLQQVFPKSQLHLLEHEEFLFDILPRKFLKAPPIVVRFSVGPFECQICEYGDGVGVSQAEWEQHLPELTQYFWSMAVPDELLKAFSTSRHTLEGRLTAEYLQRLEVALDSPEKESAYGRLLEVLPAVKACLSQVPLYIYNPDLSRGSVVRNGSDIFIISWGRWSIEHIGVSIPRFFSNDMIEELLIGVRRVRDLPECELTPAHLDLVNSCRTLERQIAQAAYGQGLEEIVNIVENPLLKKESELVEVHESSQL
ncbi:hypothetical protein [Halomonas ramblicola]|uniref:hypothetical protein n=1 Tax=Halomonas ramblicola TaxID=747349 RepID=UPI0025B3712C|nr:hypothetical protein [Halomonas ramblicola]MDN3522079.1 hypothetical protein [Halomonas ramblicola]